MRWRRRVLAVCCLSLVLVVLAVSCLNIALPALQRGLGSTATELLWFVDVYALVFAGTLLPAGALGDRFGRKGALLVGLALFALGALLAGVSNSTSQVIGARAVMGVGSATITVIFFVMFGMFFLIPQYLQFVQGHSPLEAAVRMLPSGVTMIVVAPRGPALAARIGPYRSTGVGLLSAAAGFVVLSQLGPDTEYVWLATALILMAGGSALAMPPATAAIVGSLPTSKAGVGSAVNDVTREMGGAVGIAVLGSIVSVLYRHDVARTAAGLPAGIRGAVEESIGSAVAAGPEAGTVGAAQQAFTSAIDAVFLLAAALMVAASILHLRKHRARRAEPPAPPPVTREVPESLGAATVCGASVPCSR